MNRTISTSFVTLLLSGSMIAGAAAQQPTPPDGPPMPAVQLPAPIERSAPDQDRTAPPPRGPRSARPVMMHDRGRGMEHARYHGGEHGMGMMPPGMWWHNSEVAQQLALTPEQTSRMDDILQKSRLQLVDLKANLDRQNLLLEPIMNANPVDQAKAMAQIDRVAEARADLEKANAKMLLGLRGVLTPEQWTKLHDRRGWHRGGPAEGGQGGPAGGPAER